MGMADFFEELDAMTSTRHSAGMVSRAVLTTAFSGSVRILVSSSEGSATPWFFELRVRSLDLLYDALCAHNFVWQYFEVHGTDRTESLKIQF